MKIENILLEIKSGCSKEVTIEYYLQPWQYGAWRYYMANKEKIDKESNECCNECCDCDDCCDCYC